MTPLKHTQKRKILIILNFEVYTLRLLLFVFFFSFFFSKHLFKDLNHILITIFLEWSQTFRSAAEHILLSSCHPDWQLFERFTFSKVSLTLTLATDVLFYIFKCVNKKQYANLH